MPDTAGSYREDDTKRYRDFCRHDSRQQNDIVPETQPTDLNRLIDAISK